MIGDRAGDHCRQHILGDTHLSQVGRQAKPGVQLLDFHRQIGVYSRDHFDPEGNPVGEEEWERGKDAWIPTEDDKVYVHSLMYPVLEVGKIAQWIAPPIKGIKDKPFEFEYVRRA